MPNYQKGKIYAIRSYQTEDIYIGSTTVALSKRFQGHKDSYKRYLKGKTNFLTSFHIMKYEDAYIELIKHFPCYTKEELEKAEGEEIRERNCVNRCIPRRTDYEYYLDNKEKIQNYLKEYYQKNSEKIKERTKQHILKNHQKKLDYDKNYRETHKEQVSEGKKRCYERKKAEYNAKNRAYYHRNKERINAKAHADAECECGCVVTRQHLVRHMNSDRHYKTLIKKQRKTLISELEEYFKKKYLSNIILSYEK